MPKLAFVDTNIVVYAHDSRDTKKQRVAQTLLEELTIRNQVVISSQVVQEFCHVMLKGNDPFMNINDAKTVLTEILLPLMQHSPDPYFYNRALNLYSQHSLSFYDSLIIQAALDLDCGTLYSEDLQDGQKFGTLTIVNPFKD
jgi:predicted nucleic acid-binding protein